MFRFGLYLLFPVVSLAASLKPYPNASQRELIAFLNDGFDKTVAPCDSFYDYVCGNHSSSSSELLRSSFDDKLLKLVREDNKYPSISSALFQYVDDCVQFTRNDTFKRQTGKRFMENALENDLTRNESSNFLESLLKLVFPTQVLIVYKYDISPTGLLASYDADEQRLSISVDPDHLEERDDFSDEQLDLVWDSYVQPKNDSKSTNPVALRKAKIHRFIKFAKAYRSIVQKYDTSYRMPTPLKDIKNRLLQKAIFKAISYYVDEGIDIADVSVRLDEDTFDKLYQLFRSHSLEGKDFLIWKALSTASFAKNLIPAKNNQMESSHAVREACLYKALNLQEMGAIFNPYAANLLVRSKYPMTTIQQQLAVRNMTESIRTQFRNSLMLTTWLQNDREMLQNIDTLLSITKTVGLPDEVYNEDIFTEQFNSFKGFDSGDDMIKKNFRLRFLNAKMKNEAAKLGASEHNFEINASFDLDSNHLHLNYLVLFPPFYSMEYPIAYNYGILGSTIGHEFFHRFSPPDNPNKWLKHPEFKKSVDCYKNLYNDMCYNLTLVNRTGGMERSKVCEDGREHLNENAADVEGARAAFWAIKSILGEKKMKERAMPEFDFTNEQMFFIGNAQFYCDRKMNDDEFFSSRLTNKFTPHASMRVRVNAVAMQMEEFRTAFSCESTDRMVIDEDRMCRILPSI